jgi:hypothetical protein
MNIEFDPSSIHQSKSGMITGIAYVRVNDNTCFPCEQWNDFIVVLALWWLDAANRVEAGEKKVRMQFMDGPYWIDIESKGENVFARCVDDHSPKSYPASFDYDQVSLRSEIAKFAKCVWRSCRDRKIESDDVRTLGGMLGMY